MDNTMEKYVENAYKQGQLDLANEIFDVLIEGEPTLIGHQITVNRIKKIIKRIVKE